MKRQKQRIGFPLLIAAGLSLTAHGAEKKQLLNLPKPDKPRFELTDRVWPAQAGEADVCLWKDDKFCAVSYTIDDNCAGDHDWWSEQGKKYGFKFTWFVISGRPSVYNEGFNGTWKGWSKLKAEGHDVQSHTVTHLHYLEEGRQEKDAELVTDIDASYKISIRQIEEAMPDNRCIVLAYPGGKNTKLNDDATAAKYFTGARGVTGHINKANQINYIRTSSLGNGINLNTEKGPWSQFPTLLDRSLYRGRNYRGWCCTHFHGVKEDKRPGVIEQFEFLKENEDDVWMGLFREVVLYGQERDTSELKTLSSNAREIRLSLSDDMDDTLFTFPLTVKVRLPDDWITLKATQGGKEIEATQIEHEGGRYALVQAVPDQGEIVLQKK